MGQAGSTESAPEGFDGQQLPGYAGGGNQAAGLPQEPAPSETTVVPTVLQWALGGNSVFVTGSFNQWGERIPLRKSGAEFVVCLNLMPGTYQYKFVVDNEWRFATDQQTVRDEMGNINNVIVVEDQQLYMHEDPCSGFFGDTPHNMYTQSLPDEITLAKEPPMAPLHLSLLPLNMPSVAEPQVASWSMQPPLSVTLMHTCFEAPLNGSSSSSGGATALSMMQRFRSKYVTLVIYKPTHSSSNEAAGSSGGGSRSLQGSEGSMAKRANLGPSSSGGMFALPQPPQEHIRRAQMQQQAQQQQHMQQQHAAALAQDASRGAKVSFVDPRSMMLPPAVSGAYSQGYTEQQHSQPPSCQQQMSEEQMSMDYGGRPQHPHSPAQPMDIGGSRPPSHAAFMDLG